MFSALALLAACCLASCGGAKASPAATEPLQFDAGACAHQTVGSPAHEAVTVTAGVPPYKVVWMVNGTADTADPMAVIPVHDGQRYVLTITPTSTTETLSATVADSSGSAVINSVTFFGPGTLCPVLPG